MRGSAALDTSAPEGGSGRQAQGAEGEEAEGALTVADHHFARLAIFLAAVSVSVSCGSASAPTAPAVAPAVTYTVTGTAKTVELGYTLPDGSILIPSAPSMLPFTYTWPTAQPSAHLLLSAQINTPGDQGSIRASILKNGVEVGSQTATGFPNFATVSLTY